MEYKLILIKIVPTEKSKKKKWVCVYEPESLSLIGFCGFLHYTLGSLGMDGRTSDKNGKWNAVES